MPAGPAGPPPVAIIGPTGSGKSTVAMQVAGRLPDRVEIVAVDAFTVYRGMDIGTATPTAADRAAVPHHMVDLLDVEQECSVQWFQQHARAAIDDVRGRGRVPLLVGGSGLYFRAVVDPLEFPPTDADVRAGLLRRWEDDPAAAHGQLAEADPVAADKIDPLNLRRTVRALEVMELTGRTFSSFADAWQHHRSIYDGLEVVGIELDRPALRERLRRRTDRMMGEGWLEEVRALEGRELSPTAAQAIGYAELRAHLAGELTLDAALERIEIRTRKFATRQQRWFAGDPRVGWSPPEAAADRVAAILTGRPARAALPEAPAGRDAQLPPTT